MVYSTTMEPLASKYRPKTFDEIIGQTHLVGKEGTIRKLLAGDKLPSMIFWGPPGSGKTTVAYVLSQSMKYDFYKIQAVSAGKDNLRKVIQVAKNNRQFNRQTILFLDEIHRWNKAQQDALLPFVEKGLITLIGATTENPSFNIINALLSRTKVFVFEPLQTDDIAYRLRDIAKKEFPDTKFAKRAFTEMAELANGDMRNALNTLEIVVSLSPKKVDSSILKKALNRNIYYDKHGDEHFNIISALHKSMRSSDPDASIYWTMRMLEGGEDPRYLARRMLRFASEDIGNADPQALILANNVYDAVLKLGMPECNVHLVQLAVYLANAPKDNTAYRAVLEASQDIRKYGNLPVPKHLRNATTKLMEEMGLGKGYIYDHDVKSKKSGQQCMPDKLKDRKYIAN